MELVVLAGFSASSLGEADLEFDSTIWSLILHCLGDCFEFPFHWFDLIRVLAFAFSSVSAEILFGKYILGVDI